MLLTSFLFLRSDLSLQVVYLSNAPKQHDFSKDRELRQHIAQLCKEFGIQESPDNFAISIEKDEKHHKYVTPMVTPDTLSYYFFFPSHVEFF